MAGLKNLAKDTAVYGLSSIIGKFLNYLLVPLYTRTLLSESGEYGIITNLYAWTALLLVILTYGMETGFFRFANKKELDPLKVYSSILISVGLTALLFIGLVLSFLTPISTFLGYERYPQYIAIMGIVVAIDAFSSIPFAYLRFKNRPFKFASLKLLFVVFNILLNLFFLVLCPYLHRVAPDSISFFYRPDYSVGYILIANLLSTVLSALPLIKEITGFKYQLDKVLLTSIFRYSFPLMILGIAGILNQTLDKMLYPFLIEDTVRARYELGIYGAGCKVAMVMVMFTQAFRYAYEPFVFGNSKQTDNRQTYALAMKYFIIIAWLAYLIVVCYIDILKYIIGPAYFEGLKVVPIIMLADMFFGIFFNLSFWYKLIDQTKWGAYFSILGCLITCLLNIILVPYFGYIASAWTAFVCYAVMMLLSYFIGQKRYPIDYDLKSIFTYSALALLLFAISTWVSIDNLILRLLFRTLLLSIFIGYMIKKDFPLDQIPLLNKIISKTKSQS